MYLFGEMLNQKQMLTLRHGLAIHFHSGPISLAITITSQDTKTLDLGKSNFKSVYHTQFRRLRGARGAMALPDFWRRPILHPSILWISHRLMTFCKDLAKYLRPSIWICNEDPANCIVCKLQFLTDVLATPWYAPLLCNWGTQFKEKIEGHSSVCWRVIWPLIFLTQIKNQFSIAKMCKESLFISTFV